ncbi:DUF2254 domain-containing protein [Streptomyces sp. NPDC057694]|uniref:DUF2254 domain-containing protein n=1 Tax=Streptomyces sp. NPDC057694 TaxID=3346216 RepID=UPI0036A9CD87
MTTSAPRARPGRGNRPRPLKPRSPGWSTAMAVVALGVVVGLVLPRLEQGHDPSGALNYDAGTAQATLGAIAAGMITLTGFVFTAITLVIQTIQGMSPRLFAALTYFGRFPRLFGIFVATFMYALVVLSQVTSDDVPRLSVTLAVVMTLVSAVLFLRLLVTLRAATTPGGLVRAVSAQMRVAIEQTYPSTPVAAADAPPPAVSPDRDPGVLVRHSEAPGVLQAFDLDRLSRLAESGDLTIRIHPAVGDFLATGTALATVHGKASSGIGAKVGRLVRVGASRTIEQDPAYGVRLIVDIAIRALSPAVNDPTTAVQSLDQLDDILQRLARRPLGPGTVTDSQGRARITYPAPGWDSLLSLALDEILSYGSGAIQVVRRLRALLLDLAAVCPPDRQTLVHDYLDQLDRLCASSFTDPMQRRRAESADHQGLGSPSSRHRVRRARDSAPAEPDGAGPMPPD